MALRIAFAEPMVEHSFEKDSEKTIANGKIYAEAYAICTAEAKTILRSGGKYEQKDPYYQQQHGRPC